MDSLNFGDGNARLTIAGKPLLGGDGKVREATGVRNFEGGNAYMTNAGKPLLAGHGTPREATGHS